jgi:hypothetical protein
VDLLTTDGELKFKKWTATAKRIEMPNQKSVETAKEFRKRLWKETRCRRNSKYKLFNLGFDENNLVGSMKRFKGTKREDWTN